MTKNGEFMGERTVGEVRGWEPNLQDWESMWADTNPLDGWDPNSQWVYKWNPYGLLEFGNLPESDVDRLRNIYNRTKQIPKSILPKEFQDKLKLIQDAKSDEDLPSMTEEEIILAARAEAVIDMYEHKTREPQMLLSTPPPEKKVNKMKKLAPLPEPEPVPEPEPDLVPESDEGPVEKKYFIYTTSLGANSETSDKVNSVKMILDINQIAYE